MVGGGERENDTIVQSDSDTSSFWKFSYATEGALFISAQLSTDVVSALQKVWVLKRLCKQPSAEAHM